MRMIMLLALGVIVAAFVYVRLAPHDAAAVHVQAEPRAPGDYPAAGGFIAVRQITASPEDVLQALTQVAMETDRTVALMGTVDAGMVTFVTRSKVMGFPDYTTVSIIPAGTIDNAGSLLMIEGRLRYGKSDLGVNKARIEGWLAALGPLAVSMDQDMES